MIVEEGVGEVEEWEEEVGEKRAEIGGENEV